MKETNLFPNYQVTAITDSPSSANDRSFMTDEIKTARYLIGRWAKRFSDAEVSALPVLVAVSGDYGTGKTHLLLDAAATLAAVTPQQPFILRLVAPENTPATWFHIQDSPFKRRGRSEDGSLFPLPELVSQVMIEAAATVAERAPITRPDADRIRQNPELLIQLVEDDKLNLSVVEEEFHRQIDQICGSAVSPDVKTAVAGLGSNITSEAAELWLSGTLLTADQGSTLRVQKLQAGDVELLGILVTLSALLNNANRPFVLMIDELEHFADFDRSRREKKNLTWLKRLVEALAPTSALVFVSGHTSAWDFEPNLIPRFTDWIRMVILSPEKIVEYVTFVINRRPEYLSQIEATAILDVTGGKIRDVQTVCSVLWDETDGFRKRIDPDQIHAKTSVLGARAIDEVQGLLQEMGYTVQRPGAIDNVEFDLVGYRSGVLEVAFEFRHVVTQDRPTQQLRRPRTKLMEIAPLYPTQVERFFTTRTGKQRA